MNPKPSSPHGKFHVVEKEQQYRVFDKNGHFRRSFVSKTLADQWIAQETASTHNNRLSSQGRPSTYD